MYPDLSSGLWGAGKMLDFAEFRARRFFGSLDGLRALAIVSVLWHHAARHQPLPWAEEGSMGVDLFFAVSGFLITTLLLRECDRTGSISLSAFYARRSLRIFPLYYTVLLGYVIVVAVLETNPADKARFFGNLPYFATYTSNWFVTLESGRVIFYFAWSLATEEQFYMLWPSIEKWLGRTVRWLPSAIALALVGLWLTVINDIIWVGDELLRRMIVMIAPPICLGVVLAHLLHERRTFEVLAPVLGHRAASVVLLAGTVAAILGGLNFASYMLMVLLVGACVMREDHALAGLLSVRPAVSLGQVSYGIYLFHMLVLQAVEWMLRQLEFSFGAVPQPIVSFALALPLTWAAAVASYRWYESIFLRMKERFRAAPPPVPASYGTPGLAP